MAQADSAVPTSRGLLDCSNAVQVTTWGNYQGHNSLFSDNVIFYAQPPVGCLGGEAVYFLHLQDPTMYGVNLIYDPHGPVTPVVVLLSMCDELFGFILTSGAGWQTNYPVTGDSYIVVDSFQAPGTPYQLLFWVTGPSAVPLDTPPPGNQVSTWGVIKAAYR